MPQIAFSVPHNLGMDDASHKMRNLLSEFQNNNDYNLSNVQESWVDSTAHFSFDIMGFSVRGSLFVEPSEVRLQIKFPLAALPFKHKVKREIIESIRELLA